MKRYLFFFFSILSLVAKAQETGTVKGAVADVLTHETLPGVAIQVLSDKSKGTITDVDGNYMLTLATGENKLIFSYAGYKTDTIGVYINAGQETIQNINMKTESKMLDMVVVSSGKFDQKIEDLTVSMEVIKPNIVQNKNTTSIEQALEQAPGLTILDGEPQIRGGSGFTFGVGSRVAVVVDGMPLLSGDAGRPEWGFIPVENLEQIEVIKGASSVLYGSSALSGVINVRTAYPREKPQTQITYNCGAYSLPQAPAKSWYGNSAPIYTGISLFHSRIINKNLDFVIASNFFQDQGYIGPYSNVKSDYDPSDARAFDSIKTFYTNKDILKRRARVNFNLRYRSPKIVGLNFGVNGNAMYSKTNFTLAWMDDSVNIYRAYPGAMSLQDQSIFNIDPFIKYNNGKGVSHSLQTRIFHTNNVISNNQSNESTLFYGEYQLQRKFNTVPDFTFTGGIVGSAAVSHAVLYMGSGHPNNITRNMSGYFQLDKKMWKILNLSGGFRYEYFKMNDIQSVVKPIFRMGASLKLLKATFMRYSYGQGFRFPTITERYISTSVGYFGVFPNNNLQPETSINQEVGLKQGFKIGTFKGFLDVAGFYQEYHNTIEYLFGLWNPIGQQPPVGFKFMNTGNSRVRGIDVSIMGRTDEKRKLQITTLMGYTYIEPVTTTPHLIYGYDHNQIDSAQTYTSTSLDTTGYTLKYRFKTTWKGDIEATYKGFSLGSSMRYYSHIQNIDSAFSFIEALTAIVPWVTNIKATKTWRHQKPVYVTDMRFSYTFKKIGKFSIVVNNLFNKQYFLRPMKIESPRTTAIQWTMKF